MTSPTGHGATVPPCHKHTDVSERLKTMNSDFLCFSLAKKVKPDPAAILPAAESRSGHSSESRSAGGLGGAGGTELNPEPGMPLKRQNKLAQSHYLFKVMTDHCHQSTRKYFCLIKVSTKIQEDVKEAAEKIN